MPNDTINVQISEKDEINVSQVIQAINVDYYSTSINVSTGGTTINAAITEQAINVQTTDLIRSHNALNNIQGGEEGEYYHLVENDYNNLVDENAQLGNLHTDQIPSFKQISITDEPSNDSHAATKNYVDSLIEVNDLLGTGDNSETEFTLSHEPLDADSIITVYVGGGIRFKDDDYSVSGENNKIITFNHSPPFGAKVRATYIKKL